MLGAGTLLAAIGTANLLVVELRFPALILDAEGVTARSVLRYLAENLAPERGEGTAAAGTRR
jgi:hypothetical protein